MIYSTKTHTEPPFEPQPFTLPEQPDYMLSLGVSEYTFNSAFYACYSAGLLQMLVNESMVRGGGTTDLFSEFLNWSVANGSYFSILRYPRTPPIT